MSTIVRELPRRKKSGGRKKGTPNRKTAHRAKLMAELKVDGTDPITFFASILRNHLAPLDLRFSAAREPSNPIRSRPSSKSQAGIESVFSC